MNVLIISNLFPPDVVGGYEVGCAEMAAQLESRGHRVTVLTAFNSEMAEWNDPPNVKRSLHLADVYSKKPQGSAIANSEEFFSRVVYLRNVFEIVSELKSGSYDIVYCFNLLGLGALGICDALTALRVPWVWHLMDNIPNIMMDGIRPEISALFECSATRTVRPNAFMVMSRTLLSEIERLQVKLAAPVEIVPGWAKKPSKPDTVRNRVRDDVLRFVVVGTLSEAKGTPILLEALSMIQPSLQDRITVDFYGSGDVSYFRREVGRLKISSPVTFHGHLPLQHVLDALPSYDALLFPTWPREPFGFVAVEAGMAGLAPIITRGIGASEVLQDGVSAIMIDRSAKAVAAAIISSLADPDKVARIGEAARRHIAAHLELDIVAARVETILQNHARPIQISRKQAAHTLSVCRFKQDIGRRFVTGGSLTHTSVSAPVDFHGQYHVLKMAMRQQSRNPLTKVLRSGLMKLMRPYTNEMLRLLHSQREEIERQRNSAP